MANDPSNTVSMEAYTTTKVLVGGDHDLIRGDTSSAGFTITLPPIAGVAATLNPTVPAIPAIPAGKMIVFVNIGSANTLTVAASALNGTDNINGGTTDASMTTQYSVLRLKCDGVSKWLKI